MSIVPSLRARTGLVEKYHNTAYDNVQTVAEHITTILAAPQNAQAAEASAALAITKAEEAVASAQLAEDRLTESQSALVQLATSITTTQTLLVDHLAFS